MYGFFQIYIVSIPPHYKSKINLNSKSIKPDFYYLLVLLFTM